MASTPPDATTKKKTGGPPRKRKLRSVISYVLGSDPTEKRAAAAAAATVADEERQQREKEPPLRRRKTISGAGAAATVDGGGQALLPDDGADADAASATAAVTSPKLKLSMAFLRSAPVVVRNDRTTRPATPPYSPSREEEDEEEDDDDILAKKRAETQLIQERVEALRKDLAKGIEDQQDNDGDAGDQPSDADIGPGAAVVSDEPEEPVYVPAVHPHYANIERMLGPHRPEDEFCYVRDVVWQMDESARPKEVIDLLAAISRCNYGTKQKYDAALLIKAQFDTTIREPANKKHRADGGEPVKEWTLRSIHNFLTNRANTSEAILEDALTDLHVAASVIKKSMYRAPKGKKRITERDMRLEKEDLNKFLAIVTKEMAVITLRERLRQNSEGGAGGALGGGAKAPGKKGGGAAGGGDKAVSTLMGKVSKTSTGFLDGDLMRKKDQPFS